MDIKAYHSNVYHQFFRKVDEVDFFLLESLRNRDLHRVADQNMRGELFSKMQFLFSAYLGAVVSCWEISRLSMMIDNVRSDLAMKAGMISEPKLGSDLKIFNEYFDVDGEEVFNWFSFLKVARNASAHDGTCASYGGSDQDFFYPGPIQRFEIYKDGFVPREVSPPCCGTTESMLHIAINLIPLFAKKLVGVNQSYEDKEAIARSRINQIPTLHHFGAGDVEKMVSAMIDAMPDSSGKDVCQYVEKWRALF